MEPELLQGEMQQQKASLDFFFLLYNVMGRVFLIVDLSQLSISFS
jgi:hypothetical protein